MIFLRPLWLPEVLLARQRGRAFPRPRPVSARPAEAPWELRGRVAGTESVARGAQICPLTAALSFGHGRLYCVITDNNYNRSVVRDAAQLVNTTVTGGRVVS